MRLRVNDGTQVNHDGRTYIGGEEFEASKADAENYLTAGWATEVKTARAPRGKRKA